MAISLRTAETILPDYGIYEGMFLFFDLNKLLLKGFPATLTRMMTKNRYKVSDKDIDGYEHLGRLVVTMRNYEV